MGDTEVVIVASVGKGMAINASRFWPLVSIIPESALDRTVLEQLLPLKGFLACPVAMSLRSQPNLSHLPRRIGI